MNAAAPAVAALRWTPRRLSGPSLLLCLGALLMLTLLWAAGQGAYSLPLSELPGVLLGAVTTTAPGGSGAELVFFNIRLPRLVLGLAAGAGLGLAGALMQGLFRNPLAGAGLGLLSFLATDEQLRNLQFWLLGSLGGARWSAVALVGGITLVAGGIGLRLARPLNALALGEAQAVLLGVSVERVKQIAIVVTALAVGAVTATTGIIGFIGLVAPHMVRLVAGPDHRWVLPGSALLGAVLVLLADAVARTLLQPAELPLGVLTAVVGVPFFLLLLRGAHGRRL
ncbi:MAG: FecCD family ABC transporter permease [Hydrogenophaga sp.]|uniref:FecCD family ABC transporter permease n=1 Tax=Hydrogenophaga sp. TaxID=1904254 RepID=UPI00403668D9